MNDRRRIAVDTGGTFTDFIYFGPRGELRAFKTDSVPAAPDQAICTGFLSHKLPFSLALLHGTTVATNAMLEGKLPRVALLITRGFRDIIAIGRQTRRRLYDLTPPAKTAWIPAGRIYEIGERTRADGSVEQRVRTGELCSLLRWLQRLRAVAVAVCFLHAYKNPANERAVKKFLLAQGFTAVALSSEVVNEYREYERFSTTLINTLLLPVMATYLGRLEATFRPERIHIMQSNGGIISNVDARRLPVKTILSGPAGGVVASARLGKLLGCHRLISFDMGGTSTDVSLIDGAIHFTPHSEILDQPVKVSAIDIHTVGAGGGSIARFDAAGVLRVGPESVGADPGPIFYGRGEQVSVSDANLVAGRLQTDFFGGRAIHHLEAGRALERLARPHGLSRDELVGGILQVVNSNMERAIKKISVERGYDLREFVLLSFGGAGGMHAPYMARNLEMQGVIVPFYAGVFSALGILTSDIIADHSLTLLQCEPEKAVLDAQVAELVHRHREDFKKENQIAGRVACWPSLDVRYLGQSYEITVPYTSGWRQEFHRLHERLYGSKTEERPLEVVHVRIRLVKENRRFRLKRCAAGRGDPPLVRQESVFWEEGRRFSAIYYWPRLRAGDRIPGPAVILNETCTAVVPPGFRGRVDAYLNLHICHEKRR